MTTVTQAEAPPLSAPRPPRERGRKKFLTRPRQIAVLRAWHAVLAGGFVVAWATGDENTYALHQFSGYVVLVALGLRAALAAFSPADSLLGWPKLTVAQVRDWLVKGRGRNPLFAGLALALLATVAATAASGAIADWVTWMEDPHEAASDITLAVIFAHIAFVFYQYGGRPWFWAQLRRIHTHFWGNKS